MPLFPFLSQPRLVLGCLPFAIFLHVSPAIGYWRQIASQIFAICHSGTPPHRLKFAILHCHSRPFPSFRSFRSLFHFEVQKAIKSNQEKPSAFRRFAKSSESR